MDFAFSYSSIEHNGLGRYGDPLNANADLQDVEMLSCILRPGGARSPCLPRCPTCAGSQPGCAQALSSASPAVHVTTHRRATHGATQHRRWLITHPL